MKIARICLSAGCVAALSACAITPVSPSSGYGYGYGYGYADEPVYVQAAPAPYYDVVPESPYAGGIWIGGSWSIDRGRRQWTPGRWTPPRSGYRDTPRQHDDGRHREPQVGQTDPGRPAADGRHDSRRGDGDRSDGRRQRGDEGRQRGDRGDRGGWGGGGGSAPSAITPP